MCFDPVSLALMAASTAATAGGNRLNQLAANKAIKQQAGLERARQEKYQAESDQNFKNALSDFNPQSMDTNLAKALADRNTAISNNLSPMDAGNYEAATSNQPEIVKSTIAGKLADAVAKGKDHARRMAALGATDTVGANNAINLGRAASKGAMLGGFAKGSADVSKMEQEAAGQTRSGFGDALGLAGNALSMYNMVSAPSRMGDSIFGAQVPDKVSTMPSWAPATSHYDPQALLKNNALTRFIGFV